jgi:hypothetical protein
MSARRRCVLTVGDPREKAAGQKLKPGRLQF